mmetsp:Transcript_8359/g.20346  ORF Transcript_8359/g.20346 Transcript_8359/m.20346 type:complete len:495 (-) Transcript_8359:39-1523(-)
MENSRSGESKAQQPDVKGWLLKQKHSMVKTMDKRWAELYGAELRLFDSKEAAVPNRLVDLTDATWIPGIQTAMQTSFSLETPKDPTDKRYTFAVTSGEDLQQWQGAIEGLRRVATTSRAGGKGGPKDTNRINLVALVNGKSGGKQGEELIKKIRKHVGDANVLDIVKGGPQAAFKAHAADGPNTRFIVCGGDGTVGWALQDLEKVRKEGLLLGEVAIAVLPLGTGNDMARTLMCGGGYSGGNILPLLKKAAVADTQVLDRWKANIEWDGGSKEVLMCNYFSLGYDAEVTRRFHVKRETSPHLFTNRVVNKAWYAGYGVKSFLGGSWDVAGGGALVVDGQPVILPPGVKAIVVHNIPSYAGGSDLWGKEKSAPFRKPATDDGLLEVVATYSPVHSLKIMAGFTHALRVAQGKSIKITVKKPHLGGPDASKGVFAQIDGEPYFVDHTGFHEDVKYQPSEAPPGSNVTLSVTFTHHAVATLVSNPKSSGCCTAPVVD